jgi:integrase
MDNGYYLMIESPYKKGEEGCNEGGIYTHQHCNLCGSNFKDNKRNALECPNHPDYKATKFRVHFKGIKRRFDNYGSARKFLRGLRYQVDIKSFDANEYLKDNPLAFNKVSQEWISIKEKEDLSVNTIRALKDHIDKASGFWGDRSVKDIKLKDFQLFLSKYKKHSSKSRHNYLQTIKQLFTWLYDNEEIEHLPKFPKVKFELAYRKTITKETQTEILDKLKEIATKKTWLGIKFMATYFNCRPEEIRKIKEKHIDLKTKTILIPQPKERRPKYIYLTEEDVNILKEFPTVLNKNTYFFRHEDGSRFGEKYFYKWWKKACKKLKVEGVDLYGGCRHSTTIGLREKGRTPEEIRLASGHTTNKAFSRYYVPDVEELRSIYEDTQSGKQVGKRFKKG